MFQFIGLEETLSQEYAQRILNFETKIATGKMDKVDRRDPAKTYNPRSIFDLQEILNILHQK